MLKLPFGISQNDIQTKGERNVDVTSLDAMRLANDSRLALEAQQEMKKIIRQFADLLQEEEDMVAIKV